MRIRTRAESEELRAEIGKGRRLWSFCAGVALLAPASRAATAYEEIIAPIFQARCAACHGEKKQKGQLALHTWERVARGGDSGPLWVAGQPDESELVRRLRLPADDEEHMPPLDEPQLSADEIALVVRWIERGASASASITELELPSALAAAAAELSKKLAALDAAGDAQAEPLWEFDIAAVNKARAPLASTLAELQRRFPGALTYESRTSAAIHFTAAGLGRDFGDEELTALAALRDAVVSADLSGTAITDRSAAVLGTFTKLRILRLGFTGIGDAAVAALVGLGKLEALALHETGVTAASVEALAKLPALRRLHVSGTAAAQPARHAQLPVVDAGVDAFSVVEP